MGVLYNSRQDVLDEKVRVNPLVEQADAAVTALTGAPTAINKNTQLTTNQLSVLVPSWEETGTDTIEKIAEDWDTFANSWDVFYASGTVASDTATNLDPTGEPRTLFPYAPAGAEWAACMQYEAALAALQARINNANGVSGGGGSLVVIQPTESPPSPGSGALGLGNLFPWFTPSTAQSLTNIVWVVGLGYVGVVAFPVLFEGSSLTASALRKSNPRRARRRRR